MEWHDLGGAWWAREGARDVRYVILWVAESGVFAAYALAGPGAKRTPLGDHADLYAAMRACEEA